MLKCGKFGWVGYSSAASFGSGSGKDGEREKKRELQGEKSRRTRHCFLLENVRGFSPPCQCSQGSSSFQHLLQGLVPVGAQYLLWVSSPLGIRVVCAGGGSP